MTDEQTIARLRASEMDPGDFLDALEATTEMLAPVFPSQDEPTKLRDSRDAWRLACVASWTFSALALLAIAY